MMRKNQIAALLTLVTAGALFAGCNGGSGSPDDSDVIVTNLDGYDLQGDPRSAIEFPGNTLIFSGHVVEHGEARKVKRTTPDGDNLSYIYTPVTVRVDRVFKGDHALLEQKVTIRVIGGQVGKEKTVSQLNPEPSAYRPGMKLYLFTQDFVDAGDGLMAATPNFSYAVDIAGNAYNMRNPDLKTGWASFEMQISERVGFTS